jgi:non-ribosomal peptide synthetase component F
VQYADYAAWQRAWVASGALAASQQYWETQLRGAPVVDLPTDHPRPDVPSPHGSAEALFLDPALCKRIMRLSLDEQVTPFMTLLSAFLVLLQRYTGQDDVVIGTPIAGRNLTQLESLIGFFVNMLVLRMDLSGNPSFSELLRRTRATTLAAYTHGDFPVEKLVEQLNPERHLSRNPLFNVMFQVDQIEQPLPAMKSIGVEVLDVPVSTAKVDLFMTVTMASTAFHVALHYRTDLFNPPTIRRMLSSFASLLTHAVADPRATILDCGRAQSTEIARLTTEFMRPLGLAPLLATGEQSA